MGISFRSGVYPNQADETVTTTNPLPALLYDTAGNALLRQAPSTTSSFANTTGLGVLAAAMMHSTGAYNTLGNSQLASDNFININSLSVTPSAIVGTSSGSALGHRIRAANVFKTVDLVAATAETTIWTPAAGKKFRLLGVVLRAGTASKLTFKDNTAGTTIFVLDVLTDPIILDLGSVGLFSAAANNVLTVTRSISATLAGTVWGTEE